MSILSRRRPRFERPPLPTDDEVISYVNAICRDAITSLAESAAAHLPPAVDVRAQVDAWEYDKRFRPSVFRRRLAEIELGDRAAAALRGEVA
ncbi:hypothetical protein [Sphaerisporangium sp. NPDC051011]|uniref:hypothetical protein n=1 Tax=Sphaerisporangium sp. NPDC051011 TaxID=3155792 RepID=UPI0033C0A6D1